MAGEQFRSAIRQRRLDVGSAIADVIRDRNGDTEIDECCAVLGKVLLDKDIGWLDVAVHDSMVVYVVQCVADLR